MALSRPHSSPLASACTFDELKPEQMISEKIPASIEVAIQAGRLELCQHQDLPEATVDAIRERKIDNSIGTPKRDCGFGAIPR